MEKIKFSVLMSVYKNDKLEYVKIAIDSILNQTLKPDQFVIMIDGPINNDLKNLLLSYGKKEEIIDLHFRDKNLGLGLTLNEGLKYCKYDYVARMDADDESLPNRLEEQIKFLEEHPEVDVLGSNICEYDEKLENKISIKKVPETDEEIKEYMKTRNPFNHMSVIYKKEKVLAAGSYIDCPYFEDYYLWCRMAINGCKFYNIQSNLINVRAGNSMISRRGGKNYNKCIVNFQKKIREIGFVSKKQYIKNIIIRTLVSLIPNNFRYIVYRNFLRKSI